MQSRLTLTPEDRTALAMYLYLAFGQIDVELWIRACPDGPFCCEPRPDVEAAFARSFPSAMREFRRGHKSTHTLLGRPDWDQLTGTPWGLNTWSASTHQKPNS